MAAWDNVEGFEFQHDLITPSLDRQAACLSLEFFAPLEHRSSQGESDTRWHTSLPADSAIQPGQAIWCPVHLAMKSVLFGMLPPEEGEVL